MKCLREAAQRVMNSDREYRIKRDFIFKVYFLVPIDTYPTGAGKGGGGREIASVFCPAVIS